MDSSNEIREFLATRRARITPQQAGLATYGRRRVPGLRREEVAMLAGVSTDYYARLERGNLTGVSDSVLEALARALRLDEAERAHLHDLARAANTTPQTRRRPAPKQPIRPVVQRILDGMTALPAIVLNGRLDLLAANRLAVALYSPAYDDPSRPVNLARFCFLNPNATALYPHWDDAANSTVAMLRIEAGRNPYDRDLSDLIGELSTRSETFRNRWAAHNVVLHRAGTKQFHHPAVGDLSLAYEVMELSADTGLTLTAYSPEPDSPSADGLALLASWVLEMLEAPDLGNEDGVMPKDQSPGKPTSRRCSPEQKAAAVRTLRAGLSSEHGTAGRVAHQLGYGVESLRSCMPGRSISRVSRCCR